MTSAGKLAVVALLAVTLAVGAGWWRSRQAAESAQVALTQERAHAAPCQLELESALAEARQATSESTVLFHPGTS